MWLETSGKILNVILLLGQWLHGRHQYSQPLDEADLEKVKQEEALLQEIYQAAELLTDQEIEFLAADLAQMKLFITSVINVREHRRARGRT